MARLLADENFPQPVVDELRRLGHDVLTMLDAGLAEQALPDDAVVAYAGADRRGVLTLNRRDFVALHQEIAGHHGIIVCTVDLDFVAQAQRIHSALQQSEVLAGMLIRINRSP